MNAQESRDNKEWPLLHSSNPEQPLCAQDLQKVDFTKANDTLVFDSQFF